MGQIVLGQIVPVPLTSAISRHEIYKAAKLLPSQKTGLALLGGPFAPSILLHNLQMVYFLFFADQTAS